jgi:uncharacterized SAM-binding protein YcdF (DUF218 family)
MMKIYFNTFIFLIALIHVGNTLSIGGFADKMNEYEAKRLAYLAQKAANTSIFSTPSTKQIFHVTTIRTTVTTSSTEAAKRKESAENDDNEEESAKFSMTTERS